MQLDRPGLDPLRVPGPFILSSLFVVSNSYDLDGAIPGPFSSTLLYLTSGSFSRVSTHLLLLRPRIDCLLYIILLHASFLILSNKFYLSEMTKYIYTFISKLEGPVFECVFPKDRSNPYRGFVRSHNVLLFCILIRGRHHPLLTKW